MVFTKNCPQCKQNFFLLATYMSHTKNKHDEISPEVFVKEKINKKGHLGIISNLFAHQKLSATHRIVTLSFSNDSFCHK